MIFMNELSKDMGRHLEVTEEFDFRVNLSSKCCYIIELGDNFQPGTG